MITRLLLPPLQAIVAARPPRDPAVIIQPDAQQFEGGELRIGDPVPVLIMRGPSYMLTMRTWGQWPEKAGRHQNYAAFGGNCLVPALAVEIEIADSGAAPAWIKFQDPSTLAVAGSLHPPFGATGPTFSIVGLMEHDGSLVPGVIPRSRWSEWLDNTRRMKPLAGEEALTNPLNLISASVH